MIKVVTSSSTTFSGTVQDKVQVSHNQALSNATTPTS